MAEPVPPIVNEGQLQLLLDEQHESGVLDYKRQLDLADDGTKKRALIEMAKDVAAMASGRGGHVVIGADDRGQPSGLLAQEHLSHLDEARLRPRLERYIPEGLQIRSASHEIDGCLFALIHIAPHPDGLVVMKADGSYQEGRKPKTVFREGDIFVRRGTESRRLGQAELRDHLGDIRRRIEEEARGNALNSLNPSIEHAQRAETLSVGGAELLTWDIDLATLVSALTEQIRHGDDIPLRLLMDSALGRADEILTANPDLSPGQLAEAQNEAGARFSGLLDRIVAVAARGIVLQKEEFCRLATDALVSIFNDAFDEDGRDRRDLIFDPARVWLMVIERIYALGALAVRKQAWPLVRELATRKPATNRSDRYRSWLRCGHMMAARAGLLRDPESRRVGASLLKLAFTHIAAVPHLHPDFPAEDERLLSSLCQFDMLANLAVVSENELEVSSSLIYPHYRRFYAHRSDPAIIALLEDEAARKAIFPRDDGDLAEVLRQFAAIRSDEFFFVSGWDEYEDPRIVRFLDDHPRRE